MLGFLIQASTHQNSVPQSLSNQIDPRSAVVWAGISLDPGELLAVLNRETMSHVCFLSDDDVLASDAVRAVVEARESFPHLDVIYADEDRIVENERCDPFLKPGWSPERFESDNYLGRAVWISTDLLRSTLASHPPEADLAQLLDLSIRQAHTVGHIPKILLHAGPSRFGVACRRNQSLNSESNEPSVSIVIPTGGGTRTIGGQSVRLVDQCVQSLLAVTNYARFEIVIVGDNQIAESILDALKSTAPEVVTTVRNPRKFNFSEACNLGAEASSGDILVFLNDDTQCLNSAWLTGLVTYATRAQVGAVGARLVYEDRRIQHAGIWARDGIPGHRYPGLSEHFPGHRNSLDGAQNCLAVTAACLAVEASKFRRVSGFAPEFPMNFNDVDLCLRLLCEGFRTVVSSETAFIHYESATRNPSATSSEYELLEERWGEILRNDFWDHPSHIAPAPNEYPAPQLAYLAALEALDIEPPSVRVFDCEAGVPVSDVYKNYLRGG